MDRREILMRHLRDTFPQMKAAKLQAAIDCWLSGERVILQICRDSGINRSHNWKLKPALLAGQAEIDRLSDEKSRLAEAYINQAISPNQPAPPPGAPPASISPTPNVELIGSEETVKLLSGPAYLAKIDALLLEAIEGEKPERALKILHDIRKDLADFASEMPVTHMDIERTIGLEGLAGMDQVLVETLSLFFEDIDHYPRCKEFLTQTFGVSDKFWAAKDAANSAPITAPEAGG